MKGQLRVSTGSHLSSLSLRPWILELLLIYRGTLGKGTSEEMPRVLLETTKVSLAKDSLPHGSNYFCDYFSALIKSADSCPVVLFHMAHTSLLGGSKFGVHLQGDCKENAKHLIGKIAQICCALDSGLEAEPVEATYVD